MDNIELLELLGRVEPVESDVLDRTANVLIALAADQNGALGSNQNGSTENGPLRTRRVDVDGGAFHAVRAGGARKRRRGLAFRAIVAVGVAGAVAAVVVATVVLPSSLVAPPRSAAAGVLIHATTAATSQPALPTLEAGQYYYEANIEQMTCTMPLPGGNSSVGSSSSVNYVEPTTHENWVAANGTGSVRLVSDPGGHWLTGQDHARWQAMGSPTNICGLNSGLLPLASAAAILTLPSDPKVLGALIAQGRVNDVGQVLAIPGHCTQSTAAPTPRQQEGNCSTAWQFDLVNNLLTQPIAVDKLGAVLYQILAQLPGVQLLGPRSDAAGRSGTAVEDPTSGDVIVLDPTTGALLETQSLAIPGNSYGVAPGTVLDSVTFGPISAVNGLGMLPS